MIHQRSRGFALSSSGLLLAALVGCTGSPVPTTSTVTGQLDQASFPSSVTELTLKSGTAEVAIPVDAAGRFTATVEAGSTYEILVGGSAGIPIVVHATTMRLDPTFHVKSGGATLSLGQVHYRSSANVEGLRARWPALPIANPPAVCTDDDDDDHGDHECKGGGMHSHGGHSHGEHHAGHSHGEHSDGADSAAESTDCDESDAMGLPENNLPDEVGCGEEEHDHEDSDEHDGE